MLREICQDCICLVSDTDDNWICDQVEKKVSDIEECPEGGWYHELLSE